MSYFAGNEFLSEDSPLVERIENGRVWQDIEVNKSLGLQDLFDPSVGLPLDKDVLEGTLIVIAAARDIEGERMEALNNRLKNAAEKGEKLCVVVAGAGHHALPPEGTPEEDIDPTLFVNPKYVHAAVTNFSAGNSHTVAFRNPHSHIKYFMASHCAAEELNGNGSTIQALVGHKDVPNDNIYIYDAFLEEDQRAENGQALVATGTGAPPAVISVVSALRQEVGITAPLDVELYGCDATKELFHGLIEEMPKDYIDRENVIVRHGYNTYEQTPAVYVAQTEEMAAMRVDYPDLLGSIKVDGENCLTADVFSTPDGEPDVDFEVMQDPNVGFIHPALRV